MNYYKELPEGQFYTKIMIPAWPDMEKDNVINLEHILQKNIEEHLSVLPKGTSLVSTTRHSVEDLCVPYEVIFYNPSFKSIKEVELKYVRHVEATEDKVTLLNLVVGIEYKTRDGKTL